MKTISFSSEHSVDKIAADIPQKCPSFGFSLLHSYDFFNILEDKGFPVERHARVFEVCQARVASLIISHEPALSTWMPCRFSVYEENGKTWIRSVDMQPLLDEMKTNPNVYEELQKVWTNLIALMQSLCHS